jgi:hypothetical protein
LGAIIFVHSDLTGIELNQEGQCQVVDNGFCVSLWGEKQMVDSFFIQIDWTTVAMVIGLLASVGVIFYGRRDRV